MQLTTWLKSLLALVTAALLLALLVAGVCSGDVAPPGDGEVELLRLPNVSLSMPPAVSAGAAAQLPGDKNTRVTFHSTNIFGSRSADSTRLRYELILDMLLMLVFVCFIQRDGEIINRLSFRGHSMAESDKHHIDALRKQADMLLKNILPEHVTDSLKNESKESKYSKDHKIVGVVFASIVNFSEMYDESFEGGKEYLRVLNEVVSDFDELLKRPEFSNVEKIKTIGSTYMAASGLNPNKENIHPHLHLFELMDFAIELQRTLDAFNQDLLGFNFIIRIGYNCGPVTAGVIGTTKFLYDIWGDTVNVASRMDSTGVPGHIQTTDDCRSILQDYFDFQHRAKVKVKGKDEPINVFLVKSRKPGTDYRSPAGAAGAGGGPGKQV